MTDKEFNDEGSTKGLGLRHLQFNLVGKDIPQYKESINMRGNFINFGDDNMMPNYYISLIDRSPKHNAIIHQKSSMIGGNGFVKNNLSNEAKSFIANHMNDMDLEEILARISMDLEIYGAFLLNIVWSKDRTKIAEINYMNPQTMRIAVSDDEYPQIEQYWISKDWGDINKEKNRPVLYPGFSVVDRSNPSQLLYCKNYQPGKYFYGVPEYISGSRWIEMEYEISNFHLNNIKNGFAPSMFINFPTGIPTDEEMNMNDRKLQRQLTGPKGAGKAFITYSEDKESAPIITPLETNSNDSKYIELNEIITEGILGAHRVNDPALFGLNTGLDGGLNSGQSQILNSLEMFRSQYIVPRQRFVEKVINRLARVNGVVDRIEIAEYELNFAKMDISIPDVLSILTAPISDDAKKNMLVVNGYSEEDADKLVIVQNVTDPKVESIKQSSTSSSELPSEVVESNVETTPVNDALKGLSAADNADMYRLVRDFTKGKINEHLALTRLRAYGIDEDTARKILGIDEEPIKNKE